MDSKRSLGLYYAILIVIIGASQFFEGGGRVLPLPKKNHLNFPSTDQIFNPAFPVLSSGLHPQFPASDIILQELLFAPFIILKEQNLSGKNLGKAHLSFADLRKTDLTGTDLSQAFLYGAQLDGALFNEKTHLPFSEQTALKLGMKKVP
ncbi:pentapeptide repeat-containing protein [Bdellovibrio bacteriovorus]|uniref:pentapeptide repeat-containing protein n=1 Tax=Bdellovibrio bacteriovorus TaxID=959 RepID=UPI0021CF934F|nr:pentapeptide repeat-containing protein [Bdellovibrio bacteriovorus]UXR66021.1 pentapeptide repeat-containing protein [Bdellovibrio bacteriovorus]